MFWMYAHIFKFKLTSCSTITSTHCIIIIMIIIIVIAIDFGIQSFQPINSKLTLGVWLLYSSRDRSLWIQQITKVIFWMKWSQRHYSNESKWIDSHETFQMFGTVKCASEVIADYFIATDKPCNWTYFAIYRFILLQLDAEFFLLLEYLLLID